LGGDYRCLVSAGLLFIGGWLTAAWRDASFLWVAYALSDGVVFFDELKENVD